MNNPKLFMLLLGCKPPGRHVEQHDVYFGIGESLRDLVPGIRAFWKQPNKIHIDAWREVSVVDGYRVNIVPKKDPAPEVSPKLFLINLGGYQENKFEEQHYLVLTVKDNKTAAFNEAKKTAFFKNNNFEGANSHIDDKYGIDVDDLYQIEEMLSPEYKMSYQIDLIPDADLPDDPIQLGYFKLDTL